MSDQRELEGAREELRRLGYLSHGFGRFLLQDGLRPRREAGALLLVAAKVALLAGAPAALLGAVALAAANGALAASPFDVVPLLFHLLPPLVVSSGLLFVALGGGLALALKWTPVRRIEALSLGLSTAVALALVGVCLWLARDVVGRLSGAAAVGLGLGLIALAAVLVRLLDFGLLALAVRFSRHAPGGRLRVRQAVGLVAGIAALGWGVAAMLSLRPAAAAPPPVSLPSAPGGQVLLLGIDGVLADELAYLIERGELPALAALAANGVRARYAGAPELPASFWISLATGVIPERHGVVALDAWVPRGVATPLARPGPTRLWWSAVAGPLGLAEHRPLLSSRRRAPLLWELAGRGGRPVLAVGWWGTFPAEELPGLVVAHGGYGLLAAGTSGAVAPASRALELRELARATAAEAASHQALAAMPPEAAAALEERALRPDAFYRQLLDREGVGSLHAAALYLAAIDLAAEGWTAGGVAFADLVRAELMATDALLARHAASFDTVAVVVHGGRRAPGRGVVFLHDRGCPARVDLELEPTEVAAALARALGLPQSAELPEPPSGCRWPAAPARLPTYGERHAMGGAAAGDREYLESLRSLGYL